MSQIKAAMELFVPAGPAKNIEEAKKKTYNFWQTQPVPKLGEFAVFSLNNHLLSVSSAMF